MRPLWIARSLPIALAILGVATLAAWLKISPQAVAIAPRLPIPDKIESAQAQVNLTGTFVKGSGVASSLPGAWPRFRNAAFDNINIDPTPLAQSWPSSGPAKLWSVTLGEGYSGPVVLGGKVFLLDYDETAKADTIRCLSLDDGQEIWRRAYSVMIGRNHGISRTTPAVTDKYLVTFGPKCHVVCLDSQTGDFLWGIDLVKEYHAVVPAWYAGQCPLIDGDRVILAPGGDALMVALDIKTGKPIWQTSNPNRWDQTHSSIVPVTIAGKRMFIYCASAGVAGVSADDGKLLWQTTEWKVTMANIPAPVWLGDDRILLSGGYGAGAMMIRLKPAGDQFTVETVFRTKPEIFGAEQHTPIYYKDHVYGVIPGGQLVCLTADGKKLWASGARNRFGLGPYVMAAPDTLLLANDTGTLTLARVTPEGFKPLAQHTFVEEGHDSWAPLAIASGRLLVRDMTRMVCLDISEKSHGNK